MGQAVMQRSASQTERYYILIGNVSRLGSEVSSERLTDVF